MVSLFMGFFKNVNPANGRGLLYCVFFKQRMQACAARQQFIRIKGNQFSNLHHHVVLHVYVIVLNVIVKH